MVLNCLIEFYAVFFSKSYAHAVVPLKMSSTSVITKFRFAPREVISMVLYSPKISAACQGQTMMDGLPLIGRGGEDGAEFTPPNVDLRE